MGNPQLEQALEHPLRAQLIAELSERPMSPAELAVALGKPLSIVAYHYGVLEAAGGVAADGRATEEEGWELP